MFYLPKTFTSNDVMPLFFAHFLLFLERKKRSLDASPSDAPENKTLAKSKKRAWSDALWIFATQRAATHSSIVINVSVRQSTCPSLVVRIVASVCKAAYKLWRHYVDIGCHCRSVLFISSSSQLFVRLLDACPCRCFCWWRHVDFVLVLSRDSRRSDGVVPL